MRIDETIKRYRKEVARLEKELNHVLKQIKNFKDEKVKRFYKDEYLNLKEPLDEILKKIKGNEVFNISLKEFSKLAEKIKEIAKQISDLEKEINKDIKIKKAKRKRNKDKYEEYEYKDSDTFKKDLRKGLEEAFDECPKDLKEDLEKELRSEEKEFKSIINIGDAINRFFQETMEEVNQKLSKTTKKEDLFIQTIPFLTEEELDDVCKLFEKNDPRVKDVRLVNIVPFLSEEQISRVFFARVEGLKKKEYMELFPFLSDEALSELVDKYVSEEIKNIDINVLYPFLTKEDLKKVFYYELNKEETK